MSSTLAAAVASLKERAIADKKAEKKIQHTFQQLSENIEEMNGILPPVLMEYTKLHAECQILETKILQTTCDVKKLQKSVEEKEVALDSVFKLHQLKLEGMQQQEQHMKQAQAQWTTARMSWSLYFKKSSADVGTLREQLDQVQQATKVAEQRAREEGRRIMEECKRTSEENERIQQALAARTTQ